MRHALALSFILLAAPACAMAADPSPSTDKLVGVWGSERVFGPAVAGSLTLDGRSEPWQARVAGFGVSVQHDKDQVSFSLPGKQGRDRKSVV